jgi:ecdysteroid 25-hydroxylase CYP306A1
MEPFWIVFAAFLVGIFTYLWHITPRNLPPGPWNLPVIGYLAWLDPKFPYLSLTDLSRRYGPVFGLRLGNVYTVVISDAKLVKKIFNKDATSGRAPLYLTHGIMQGYGRCTRG